MAPLFFLLEQVWVASVAPEMHKGLNKPGPPKASSVFPHGADDSRILGDCSVGLSDGDSPGQAPKVLPH